MFRFLRRWTGRRPGRQAHRPDTELPLLHSVLRHLPAGILYADRDAQVTNANDAFLSMLGRRREEMERGELNWVEMTPSGWVDADQRAIVELMASGACAPYEKELRRADGTRLPVLFGAALLPSSEEMVGFVLDLTKRKQAEDRVALLAEAGRVFSESLDPEETLRSLVELAVPRLGDYALIFAVQEGGALRQVAFRHADPAKEALLRTLGEIYEASSENPSSFVWRTVSTGRSELVPEVAPDAAASIAGNAPLLDLYQQLSPRSFLAVPMAARGETLGALLVATAESRRPLGPADLELAEELAARAALAIDNARLYNRAEAASRAKDHFLAALSHELRTPLTPVLLRVAALAGTPELAGELRADLRMIQRNVELEAKLIDDLLDLTRITRGKLALHFEVVGVHEVLQHVAEICGEEAASKQISIDVGAGADEQHVWADPGRLRQVFWNLVKNAVKFTPAGGRIMVRTSNPEPGKLQVQVIDPGIGIEPEVLPRLFNAFEQGDPTVTRSFGGLGLGLAVSKALVDQHSGVLTGVSPGRGLGATFTVTLATVAATPAEEVAVVPDGGSRGLRLLLVEDHAPTLEVMAALLEIAGHEVNTAIDLRSARELAASRELDLVVSDLGLPDGTGFDLMRELRDQYGLKGIAVSGYGMEEDLRRSREAGFLEHLVKPVDVEKLKAALARASAARA
ncbi:MAG: ATP-binding protein [Thermoanaerobaculia bacterium]